MYREKDSFSKNLPFLPSYNSFKELNKHLTSNKNITILIFIVDERFLSFIL